MLENTEQNLKIILKEIKKHAERDNCYSCKQLLKITFLSLMNEEKPKVDKK